MKKVLWLFVITISSVTFAQQKQTNSLKENYFKIGFQAGFGFGFKNIDLIAFDEFNADNERVDSGEASISGGGGWSVTFTGEYVFKRMFSLGVNLGYQSSHLRPILENASVRFIRYTFQPTVKYLVGISPQKDQTINLGIGYGFYTGSKLKLDAAEVNLVGNFDYNSTSGIHLLTEYEYIGPKKFGFVGGIKYYGVNYDIKQTIGDSDFDELKGSGIDFYIGLTYSL